MIVLKRFLHALKPFFKKKKMPLIAIRQDNEASSNPYFPDKEFFQLGAIFSLHIG